MLVTRKCIAVDRTKKFIARSNGRCQVVKQMSPVFYSVEDLPFNTRERAYRCFNSHASQMHPFRTRRETKWRPDLWQDPPPVTFEEVTEPVSPEIDQLFLQRRADFMGLIHPRCLQTNSTAKTRCLLHSTPLIPVDSQTTRFGRVSGRKRSRLHLLLICFHYLM